MDIQVNTIIKSIYDINDIVIYRFPKNQEFYGPNYGIGIIEEVEFDIHSKNFIYTIKGIRRCGSIDNEFRVSEDKVLERINLESLKKLLEEIGEKI